MMLELTDGGRCMSGMDAIEFFERLDDVLDEDVKTEQFCDEFTWALNRLRVEVRKSISICFPCHRTPDTPDTAKTAAVKRIHCDML